MLELRNVSVDSGLVVGEQHASYALTTQVIARNVEMLLKYE